MAQAVLANMRTFETQFICVGSDNSFSHFFEFIDAILNSFVPNTLKNITMGFRAYGDNPDYVNSYLKGSRFTRDVTALQHTILRLSPQSVTFNAEISGDGHRTNITRAMSTANSFEGSFSELYERGIAKTVLPKGECKFLTAHTDRDDQVLTNVLRSP